MIFITFPIGQGPRSQRAALFSKFGSDLGAGIQQTGARFMQQMHEKAQEEERQRQMNERQRQQQIYQSDQNIINKMFTAREGEKTRGHARELHEERLTADIDRETRARDERNAIREEAREQYKEDLKKLNEMEKAGIIEPVNVQKGPNSVTTQYRLKSTGEMLTEEQALAHGNSLKLGEGQSVTYKTKHGSVNVKGQKKGARKLPPAAKSLVARVKEWLGGATNVSKHKGDNIFEGFRIRLEQIPPGSSNSVYDKLARETRARIDAVNSVVTRQQVIDLGLDPDDPKDRKTAARKLKAQSKAFAAGEAGIGQTDRLAVTDAFDAFDMWGQIEKSLRHRVEGGPLVSTTIQKFIEKAEQKHVDAMTEGIDDEKFVRGLYDKINQIAARQRELGRTDMANAFMMMAKALEFE